MLKIHLYFNKIAVHGDTGQELAAVAAEFSNRRLIVSEFGAYAAALKTVRAQLREQQGGSGLLPQLRQHLLAPPPLLCFDVRDQLTGGLSPVEWKVLTDAAILVNGGRGSPNKIDIRYLGQPLSAEAMEQSFR